MSARHDNTVASVSRACLLVIAVVVCCLAWAAAAAAVPSSHEFELVPGSFHMSTSSGQAAAHANWTVSFDFAHESSGQTYNDGRTTVVELPPGFIGDNTTVPTCTFAQLVGSEAVGETKNPQCIPASQVGTISFDVHTGASTFEHVTIPLYNMEVTSFGVTAELGFNYYGTVIQALPAEVRPGDSGITITSPNIERSGEFHNVSVTTWGLPASHENDPLRGRECYGSRHPECEGGGESANVPVRPFLSNPTSCEAHIAKMHADSWEQPEKWTYAEAVVTPATSECAKAVPKAVSGR